MKTVLLGLLPVLFVAALPAASYGQLVSAKEGPIVYGHHHVYTGNMAEARRFWADALGGVTVKLGFSAEPIRFTNVWVFLMQKKPTAGSKGSTVNHVGFFVPNIRATIDRLKAAGYPNVTRQELPAVYKKNEKDGIAFIPNQNTSVAFVMAPDGVKVEFHEDKAMKVPIALSHIHFFTPQVEEMRAWYVKVFGATPSRRGDFETALLPGVQLTYTQSPDAVAPTHDRALDHIGFEVRNLEAFAKKLQGMGIKLDRPYAKVAAVNLGVVFFTDPWGTTIELTEGLDKLQ
jgi:catechol 2,3-dioxygenase-like lactoylglutathione lyase family enzyme